MSVQKPFGIRLSTGEEKWFAEPDKLASFYYQKRPPKGKKKKRNKKKIDRATKESIDGSK